MDDNQTYLLNGLISRHFGLGRIVRFRAVQRGRQAECFEVFTAQEKEYLVQLFPPAYAETTLELAAAAVNGLDRNRFSVMPFVASKQVVHVAPGPQGSHMVVSLAPVGSALRAAEYTVHDVSQVGLRLAWMHRLLKENLPAPRRVTELAAQLPADISAAALEPLQGLLRLPVTQGWTHGDIQLAALLHDGDHQLRAIVDWGLLHWGCPLEDLVDAFIALATDGTGALNQERGTALLEAYDTLVGIRRTAWTPVVAHWCAQRLVDREKRKLPDGFLEVVLGAPERLATAMASCM